MLYVRAPEFIYNWKFVYFDQQAYSPPLTINCTSKCLLSRNKNTNSQKRQVKIHL